MGTTVRGPNPWPEITRAASTRGPRSAAIAYLGAAAPKLLALRRNDILVVNAGRDALRAHATSPDALQHFLDRGVVVYSSPTLHAKMLATATQAVIGSANASHHSTTAAEAVVISDDPAIVKQVHALVARLAETETIEVDQIFIDQAHTEWQRGNPVPLVGVGDVGPGDGFLPTPVKRVFIEHSHDYEASAAETALQQRIRRTVRRTVPAATYGLQWLRVDSPGHYRIGDVLLFVDEVDGVECLFAPYVVTTPEHRIPRGHGAVGYYLRYRTDLEPIPVADAVATLGRTRLPTTGSSSRGLRVSDRKALLSLWGL